MKEQYITFLIYLFYVYFSYIQNCINIINMQIIIENYFLTETIFIKNWRKQPKG